MQSLARHWGCRGEQHGPQSLMAYSLGKYCRPNK